MGGKATLTTVDESAPELSGNPFNNTMPLWIGFSMLGISKKVKSEQVEVDADKDMVTVSKKLLDCEEYKAVSTVVGGIKTYLRRRSVPGGGKLFRSSTFPIPIKILGEVDEWLKVSQLNFWGCVSAFCAVYEQRRDEALERLRGLADAGDYPAVEKVRRSFNMEFEYVSFGPPSSLKSISKDLYEREMKKVQDNCQQAAEQVQEALRLMFQDLLDHMVEKLTPGKDGKPKIFRDSLIGNMSEFLKDFQNRNITNDEELAALVTKCDQVLKGRSPNMMRRDNSVRELTVKALGDIKKSMEGMVGNQAKRKIDLDD